jgi:alkylation response protein AidB-like acyl-CoA dehydrogenase
MNQYEYPLKDAQFLINEVLSFSTSDVASASDLSQELSDAILEEAARFGGSVLAPLNPDGDKNGAKLTAHGVEQTPGFKEAYQQFSENGWSSLAGPVEFEGQGLPHLISTAVNEVWQASNMAFALCPLLTQGAIEALVTHADDALKTTYLTKMVSGEWTATMNLTEPDAGSDLAAIKSRALPERDHYRISGQKIFITWGDHQMTDNIVHLVLARLPDAPAGVKGISLFVVPKFLQDESGAWSVPNDLKAVSLEHKLGIHGSPTCVMSYGEEGGAIGYLVGAPHSGLACMFTMMNDARQNVGLQGLAISERAYQQARAYAHDRIQGTLPSGERVNLFAHADVRRMLLMMKSAVAAMRGVMYRASFAIDHSKAAPTQPDLHARVELWTPIVKGWMTELGQEVTSLAVQVHGGMGYIEETGVAQHFRDARILPIYEGTTGIQGLDLVGRKLLKDKGAALTALLDEFDHFTDQPFDKAVAPCALQLKNAIELARSAKESVLANPAASPAVGVNLMMLLGFVAGAWSIIDEAQHAAVKRQEADADTAFLETKQMLAAFYCAHWLPRVQALHTTVLAGDASIMTLNPDQF